MNLFSKLVSLVLCSALSTFAASFVASVGNPSAPESEGCSSRTTGITAVCTKTLNSTYGTALISGYADNSNVYYVLGTLQNTQPSGSTTTVTTSVSATITEVQPSSASGGVKVTNTYRQDCAPVEVSVNGEVVATLTSGASVSLPASTYGTALTIQLAASQTPTSNNSAPDNVNTFSVRLAPY